MKHRRYEHDGETMNYHEFKFDIMKVLHQMSKHNEMLKFNDIV